MVVWPTWTLTVLVSADAAALTALGVTDDERKLAALYGAGRELWQVPITHFSLGLQLAIQGCPTSQVPQPETLP